MKSLTDGSQEVGQAARPPTYEELLKRISLLEGELRGQRDLYLRQEERYVKLADIWNAYQATTKPTQRDVHRAEEAGELARKLAEVFIGLAYKTRTLDDLIRVLQDLKAAEEGRLPPPR